MNEETRKKKVRYVGYCAYNFPGPHTYCACCGFHNNGQHPLTLMDQCWPTDNQGNVPRCLIKAFLDRNSLQQGEKFRVYDTVHNYFLGCEGNHTRYYYIQNWELHHTDNGNGTPSSSSMWKICTGRYVIASKDTKNLPASDIFICVADSIICVYKASSIKKLPAV